MGNQSSWCCEPADMPIATSNAENELKWCKMRGRRSLGGNYSAVEQNSLKVLSFPRLCEGGDYCNSITMTVQSCGSDLWPHCAGREREASRSAPLTWPWLRGPWSVWVICWLYAPVSGGGRDPAAVTATFTAGQILLCVLSHTAACCHWACAEAVRLLSVTHWKNKLAH